MKIRITVTVTGRVQGVAYRHHTQLTAIRLVVTGWVRNLSSGAVEACLEGEESAVAAMTDWCRIGPPAARVERVEVMDGIHTGEFEDFQIRY